MASGNYTKSAVYLRRAREVRPEDAAAAFDFGKALNMIGDLPGARDALDASLRLNPTQYAARLLLGRVYSSLNDLSAAQDQFEAAVLLQPSSIEAQISLATVLIARKNFAAAAEQLEVVAGSNRDNTEIFELLAQAYTGLGNRQEALRAKARAKAIPNSNPPQ